MKCTLVRVAKSVDLDVSDGSMFDRMNLVILDTPMAELQAGGLFWDVDKQMAKRLSAEYQQWCAERRMPCPGFRHFRGIEIRIVP